jgi:hypothetical protein
MNRKLIRKQSEENIKKEEPSQSLEAIVELKEESNTNVDDSSANSCTNANTTSTPTTTFNIEEKKEVEEKSEDHFDIAKARKMATPMKQEIALKKKCFTPDPKVAEKGEDIFRKFQI